MHRCTVADKRFMAMHLCQCRLLCASQSGSCMSLCVVLVASRGIAGCTQRNASSPLHSHTSTPHGLYRSINRVLVVNHKYSRAALWWASRAASDAAGRRPTYDEIVDALRVLGVSADVDTATLKRRYRELVKANHPDAGGSETKMAAITVAYDRLSGLSKYEWDAFRRQKRGFTVSRSPSSPYNTNAYNYNSGNGGGGSASYAYSHNAYYGSSQQQGFAGASPYGRPGGMSAQDFYYNFGRGGGGSGSGSGSGGFWSYMRPGMRGGYDGGFPFNAGPFGPRPMMRGGGAGLRGSYLLQGLVVYLFLATMFLFMYRSYRDWAHDDGWRMAESLARHEQMQELQRIRQELNERMRYGEGATTLPSDDARVAQAWPLALRAAKSAEEQRNLLLARQRRLEQQAAEQQRLADLRGWPTISEDQGVIYRRAQDPVGVVIFEPTRDAVRQRQLVSRQRELNEAYRTTDPSATKAKATQSPATAPAQQQQHRTAGPNVRATTATAADADVAALPPERSAGVVAIAVENETEARAAVRSILHTLATTASPNDAHPLASPAAAATPVNAEARKV